MITSGLKPESPNQDAEICGDTDDFDLKHSVKHCCRHLTALNKLLFSNLNF
jgi:hypothetical protein